MYEYSDLVLSTSIFTPTLSPAQTEYAWNNVKKSVRGNPVDNRRIYWYNVYLNVLKSRYLFVLQNNNMPASQYRQLRNVLKQTDIECLLVRNAVFAAAARSQNLKGLNNLFQGQTLVWFSQSDNENIIKNAAKIAKDFSDNLLLVGAHIDSTILTADTFEDVKNLPPKTILYGQLLGLLNYPASHLVSILQQHPQMLAATLDQRRADLEKSE
jgi:large subunit ribosomal protein L10